METFHRRSLPHWYMPHAAHFITYRLAGTLPAEVLRQLKELKEKLLRRKHLTPLPEHRRQVHGLVFEAYERYLDQVRTINWLGNPQIASMIRQNLYYHDGSKYHLHAYCIMPNHVHLLLTPRLAPDVSDQSESPVGETSDSPGGLSNIMHSLRAIQQIRQTGSCSERVRSGKLSPTSLGPR